MSNLFIGLILALLATLSAHDPNGRALVGSYAIQHGSIPWLLGYTFTGDQNIYLNTDWILQRGLEAKGDRSGIIDAYAVGACAIVHEAVHIRTATRFPQGDEELPGLYQYVCLDRLGASDESKQILYDAITRTAREKYP